MDISWKNKWLAALRSGEYNQGYDQLRNLDNKFCCLGVLCDIVSKEIPEYQWKDDVFLYNTRTGKKVTAFLPSSIKKMMGITNDSDITLELTYLNDIKKYDFSQIANHIELVSVIAPLEGDNYD